MNVLIAGGDPTGAQLAALLLEQGYQVSLIEDRREVLAELHGELPTEIIIEDNLNDLRVLEEAGIRDADVLVACTASDANNLALCHVAKTIYHTPRTIGRINNPRHAWLFNHDRHVDVALNESSIFAHLIQEEMSLGDMMTLLKLRRGEYSLVEIKVPSGAPADGATIVDLPIPRQCVIVAVLRKGEMIVPRGTTSFAAGDEVLAITDNAGAQQLHQLFADQPVRDSLPGPHPEEAA